MNCSVCKYSWCWICGFKSYNWFHKLQPEDGILCEFFNSAVSGREEGDKECWDVFPKFVVVLFLFVMLLIGPLLALTPFILFISVELYDAFMRCHCCKSLRKNRCCCKLFSILLKIIFFLGICLPLALIGVPVAAAIAALPYYLFIFSMAFIMFFRWICKSKKVKQSKKQKKIVEEFHNNAEIQKPRDPETQRSQRPGVSGEKKQSLQVISKPKCTNV